MRALCISLFFEESEIGKIYLRYNLFFLFLILFISEIKKVIKQKNLFYNKLYFDRNKLKKKQKKKLKKKNKNKFNDIK